MLGIAWGALASIGIVLLFERINASRSNSRMKRMLFAKNRLGGFNWTDLAISFGVSLVILMTQVPALAAISFVAVFVGLRQRRLTRERALIEQRSGAWPDAIDFLISSIRAGISIGPSLIALAEQGPDVLKPVLFPAREALLGGATVSQALVLMRAHAQDPVADRIALILEISQSVGGTSLGMILRSLSSYVRAESRTRAELVSRQAWTINAAKLAVAAPWLIVLLLSIRAHEAYATATGSMILLIGSLATSVGYSWMKRAARLPLPTRLA